MIIAIFNDFKSCHATFHLFIILNKHIFYFGEMEYNVVNFIKTIICNVYIICISNNIDSYTVNF